MKKIILLTLLTTLSLTTMAQKRVAVYVNGEDATLSNIVAGEMVRIFSQSRNYTAVNRSDDFSKQIQNERSYQQSGMVDDRQVVRLGKESGVDYVCAVNIKKIQGYEYSIEARLIDVQTGDIKTSDRRNASYGGYLNNVYDEVRKIGDAITNFESRLYRNRFLQYSEHAKSKVVLNDYGKEQPLGESEIRSLLITNPEAFDLYEQGMYQSNIDAMPGVTVLLFGATLGTAVWTIIAFTDNECPLVEKMASGGLCALNATCTICSITHPIKAQIRGKKNIKKAINMYNAQQAYAENMELRIGVTTNGFGLTLNF